MKSFILISLLFTAIPLQAAAAAGAGVGAIDPKKVAAAKQALQQLTFRCPQHVQEYNNFLQVMTAALKKANKTTYAKLLSKLSQVEAEIVAEDKRNTEILSTIILTNPDCLDAFGKLMPHVADCAPLTGLYATHTKILDRYTELQKELSDLQKAHVELADKLQDASQVILRISKERNALKDQLAGIKAQQSAPQNQPAPQVEGAPAAK